MKRAHDGKDRRSSRLSGFDYTAPGAYFVTICTRARDHLFGEVVGGVMALNDCARDLTRIWARTVNGGRTPEPYDFVVMPNHVHGIVWLPSKPTSARWQIPVGAQRPFNQDDSAFLSHRDWLRCHSGQTDAAPLQRRDDDDRTSKPEPDSLGATVRSFKSMTSRKINRVRATPGLPVWQRGYHERIIRNERELARVRQYILNNPLNWQDDPNNAGGSLVPAAARLDQRPRQEEPERHKNPKHPEQRLRSVLLRCLLQ